MDLSRYKRMREDVAAMVDQRKRANDESEPSGDAAERPSDDSGDLPVPVRADANPGLVATAKFIRGLLPGGETPSDALTTSGQLRRRLSTQLSTRTAERPSAMSELGLGALQAWEALSEVQRRRRGDADVAILFTDLVGFSSWALKAGDESAIKLLNDVGAAEGDAIADRGGVIVKRLGDGSMAVFDSPGEAVLAAHDAQARLAEIDVDGYTPTLRAGVHLGQPRKVGKDYLGVDVNIAARVGEAAKGDEILISNAASDKLDSDAFKFGRTKRLKAEGAPEELVVSRVEPRA
jgi:adenylate cyclase